VENLIREAGTVEVQRPRRWRAVSVFAALALVLGGIALTRAADDAVPKTDVVTNIEGGQAVVDGAGATLGRTLGFGAPTAQLNIPDFVCDILASILASFAGSPFGGIVSGVIQNLLVLFDCPS